MKKLLLTVLILIVLILIGVYVIIPNKIVASQVMPIKSNVEASYRILQKQENWQQWWPQNSTKNSKTSFSFNGRNYELMQKAFKLFAIKINNKTDSLTSQFVFIPLSVDSMFIEWRAEKQASTNPVKRMQQFFEAKGLQSDMHAILSGLKPFLEDQQNLYGIRVSETLVKDSALVSSRIETKSYPSVQQIYAVIQKLKNYIDDEGARETDYPMLHVDSAAGKFSSMVAIPTSKVLQGKGDIIPKRMVLGNILVAEVKGGSSTIRNGLNQLQLYVDDHRRASPAMPYQSLVTDRLSESDTSKWVTKIYYPVL